MSNENIEILQEEEDQFSLGELGSTENDQFSFEEDEEMIKSDEDDKKQNEIDNMNENIEDNDSFFENDSMNFESETEVKKTESELEISEEKEKSKSTQNLEKPKTPQERMNSVLSTHKESEKKLNKAFQELTQNPELVKADTTEMKEKAKEKELERFKNIRFQNLINPKSDIYESYLREGLLYPVVPQHLLPTKTDIAYERDGIPQLVSQILSRDDVICQKALIILCQMFHKPENIYLGFIEDVLSRVIKLIYDDKALVRQKVTELLYLFSTHVYGRQKILEKLSILNTLSSRFYDEDFIVRKNTYNTFLKLCETQDGIDAVLNLFLFNRLVKLIEDEKMSLKSIILEIIAKCIRYGKPKLMPSSALKLNIIVFFKSLLLSIDNSEEVKISTAKCVQALCYYKEGKELACKYGLIDIFVQLMVVSSPKLKRESASALMWITLNCDAKKKMNKDGIHSIIWMLNDDSDTSFQLSLIKILTNCAEDPIGREIIELNCSTKLKKLSMLSSSPLIVKASRIALSVIYWKPWTKYNFEEESKKFII
ncbi:ARM repeat-containing protein [Anaeromyces robustus]|uniref:ARM repeat-containing protein n=1 Tax=Anaeromyces robustus TaxID=1754192 RepID=A0A1Y1X6F9_9FUNG|nr:ARM repeat-containing protein [Anaeromyces robustus]|eukprot:ORX81383.1 ARM repeat-containing protein [Anaeromyces robustus]